MISPVKAQLVALLTLGTICPMALAGEPNDVNEPLRFEISSVRLGLPDVLLPRTRTPYAAAIAPQGSTDFFPWPRTDKVGTFISFAREDPSLSLRQKEFLEDTEGLLSSKKRSSTFLYPPDDPNHPQVLLYAVSLPDAKRMAQLYLQFARELFLDYVNSLERNIRLRSEQIANAEKRLPEVEKWLETTQNSFTELKRLVPYRTEQEALEAIGELDRMLNTAQVEIAGIRARIEVIQSYQREKQQVATVAPRLELLFIEEAVAMRGAEARKQMATELRTRASRFIDLNRALKDAASEKDQIPRDLKRWQEELQESHKRLADLKEREPKIRDNTVIIYPLGHEPGPAAAQP